MTRLSINTPFDKKHVPHLGNQRKQHNSSRMQTEGEWQRKPSMPAYSRPKQWRWDIDLDADYMDMETSHDT